MSKQETNIDRVGMPSADVATYASTQKAVDYLDLRQDVLELMLKMVLQGADPPLLFPPSAWEILDNIKVIDPDGWRGSNGQNFYIPISYKEWLHRISQSTTGPME